MAGILRAILPRDAEAIGYVPAGPPSELTVGEVLRAIRGETESGAGVEDPMISHNPAIRETLGDLERAWCVLADQTSLETLADEVVVPGLG